MSESPGLQFSWDLQYPAPATAPQTRLHTFDLCEFEHQDSANTKRVWIFYIHSGGWRNLIQDSRQYEPIIRMFSASPCHAHIAAVASINYRLSHRPSAPVPDDPALKARHPDHVHDVISAIKHVYKEHNVADTAGYILVGASAGATIAYQVAQWHASLGIPPSLAVVGFGGIYDLPRFFTGQDEDYREMITGAFGENGKTWGEASPALVDDSESGDGDGASFHEMTNQFMLVHSVDDEIVNEEQTECMEDLVRKWMRESSGADADLIHQSTSERRLQSWRASRASGEVMRLISRRISGLHEEMWEKPQQMVECLSDFISEILVDGDSLPQA